MGICAPENLPERQKTKIRYKLIGEKKKEVGIDGLCAGLPAQFKRFLEYARNELLFDEKPDYNFLRNLFTKVMSRAGITADTHYDWDELDEHPHENTPEVSSTNKAVRGTPQT